MTRTGSTAGTAGHDGFTLIELLVTMAVLGIAMRLVLPEFSNVIISSKLSSYASSFTGSVRLARSEAIKRNANITMCRASSDTGCAGSGTWQQGWIVFRDVNGNGTVDTGIDTLLQRQEALTTDVRFASTDNNYSIAFQSAGGVTATDLILCRTGGEQTRRVTLTSTGRVIVERPVTNNC